MGSERVDMGSTCTVSATYCHTVSGMINSIMQVGVCAHCRDGAVATESLRRATSLSNGMQAIASSARSDLVTVLNSHSLGIAKTPLALSRWAQFYNHRSQIADTTLKMFGL